MSTQVENTKQSIPDSNSPQSPEDNQSVQKRSPLLIIGVLLVIVVLVTGAFYFFSPKEKLPVLENKKPLKHVTLRLNWMHSANFSGFYVAKEKGFYKQAGLDVTLKEYEENLDQSVEVGEEKVEFGISTPLETILSINDGKKIKTVAAIHQVSPAVFASLKKANITSPIDLKGKVLGVQGGNKEGVAKYTALLNSVGLKKSDATFKNLDYNDTMVVHLTRGDSDIIDLYRNDDTYFLDQEQLSYNLLLPEAFGIMGYGHIIITSHAMIQKNPQVVKDFIKATLDGWQYALDHKDEALQITTKYENEQYKDPAREKYILDKSDPLIRPTGGEQIGKMNFIIWNQIVRSMQNQGLIKQSIYPFDMYTNDFIN